MEKILEHSSQGVLSVCMIVKNEKENLPRSLASVKPYTEEIIVVDTGSEDNTTEIALSYGAKVSYFQWCNDFAAARNYAIAQATGQWILMLDADEELIVSGDEFYSQLQSSSNIIAYMLHLKDAYAHTKVGGMFTRLFRNIPELRYKGRFHEYITYRDRPIAPQQIGYLEDRVTILHYGYVQELLVQKHRERNIPLLEQVKTEEGLNLMLLHALADAYESNGQMDKVEGCYSEALEQLFPHLLEGVPPEDYRSVPTWLSNLGIEALRQKDYETLLLLCQRGLEWYPDFPPILHLAGSTLGELGFPLGTVPYFQKCLQLGRDRTYYKAEPFEAELMTTHAAYNLGCTYYALKSWQEAIEAFTLTLSFSPEHILAKEKLVEAKQALILSN